MSTRLQLTGAVLAAWALCGCATIATTARSTAAADRCADSAVGGNGLKNCAQPGVRSYSQTDLERTGKTSAADALALLDPAVVVKH